LLRARRDYELKSELQRLDRFQVVILDDICYLQQSREATEVGSLKLLFSEWDQMFKDPLTTAAALDRLLVHSIVTKFGKEIPNP
jgi:DNA replication protein DnaC